MAPLLRPDQRDFYSHNGYLVIPALFAKEELEVWLERLRAIVEGQVEPAPPMLAVGRPSSH